MLGGLSPHGISALCTGYPIAGGNSVANRMAGSFRYDLDTTVSVSGWIIGAPELLLPAVHQ